MSTYKRIRAGQVSKRNRLFKRICVFILLCCLLAGGYHLLRQPQLAFGIIYITGTDRLIRDDIIFLTGLKEPVNFFLLDKNDIETTLKKDVRIKEARVSYEFPNILQIAIEEERPLFYFASNYGYVSIGSQKEVLEAGKSIKNADAPIVSGISGKNAFVGDIIDDKITLHVFEFLSSLDSLTRLKISEVNVADTAAVKVIDLAGRPYLMGDIRELDGKIANFEALIKDFSEKNIAVEFIDLSYSQPYIKIKQQT